MKNAYTNYIFEHNKKGSNKANSYLRALELLNMILAKPSSIYPDKVDLWSIDSITEIEHLYQYALENQKKEGSEFLQFKNAQSYGKNGYYSAALKSYANFLYEKQLWQAVDNARNGTEVVEQIDNLKIEPAKFMADITVDVNSKQGTDVIREVKTRLQQGFFRKMILRDYNSECAITGLNVPEVLRASHIISWAEDRQNRLNPCNGICLSATYDAAFDRHLISFDEDYRMILNKNLQAYCTNQAFIDYFQAKEGEKLLLPKKFLPDQKLLEQHRGQMVFK